MSNLSSREGLLCTAVEVEVKIPPLEDSVLPFSKGEKSSSSLVHSPEFLPFGKGVPGIPGEGFVKHEPSEI